MPVLWEYVFNRIWDISSLNANDEIRIIAHYQLLVDKENRFDEEKLRSRGYSEEKIEQVKKTLVKNFKPVTLKGYIFKRPLEDFKHSQMGFFLDLHSGYTKGNLPFDGGICDQPGQVMDIIHLLDSLDYEQTEREYKKIEDKRHNGK